jgi:hypothetical protein
MTINQFLDTLSVPTGVTLRYDCPACGGGKTLAVTNDYGNLKWQCFRASCKTRGQTQVSRTPEDLKAQLLRVPEEDKTLILPEYFTSVLGDEEAVNYLRKNHCSFAYNNKLVEFKFDPRQRRVVFLIKDQGRVIDAAGRALDRKTKPKWHRYGRSKHPFICGNSDVAALVEDGASACAVSPVVTGVALLGTSLQDSFLSPLRRFSKVYICLDKDASKESIAMHRVLSYYVDTEVRLLDDDLKYLQPSEIRKTLKLSE